MKGVSGLPTRLSLMECKANIRTHDGFVINGHILEKYIGTASEVVIPDDVLEIGQEAFRVTYNGKNMINQTLVSVDLNHVRKIGKGAFYMCTALKNVYFHDELESVGELAFLMSGLESICLPDSIKTIDDGAFMNCDSLKNIKLPSGLGSIPDALLSFCRTLKSIKIPNGIKCIKADAFFNCSLLNSITISESVEVIEKGAFAECSELDNVIIPESVSMIETEAFMGCSALKNVKIMGNPIIGSDAFKETPYSDNTSADLAVYTTENVVEERPIRDFSVDDEIDAIEKELAEIQKKQETLSARLAELKESKKDLDIIQNTDIFRNSGKTMQELIAFLKS